MAIEPTTWAPDWAVAPGELLLETLDERNMSQSELARRMGRPTKTINEIVNAKAALTPDTAIQLELTLGISATFWNNLEATYREHLARQRVSVELEAVANWADQFPVSDLVRHRLIPRSPSKGATVEALLRFFGVGSPAAWESQWGSVQASFRASPSFTSSVTSIAAWLRWGELQAARVEVPPFDAKRLRTSLAESRSLSRQADFVKAVERLQARLASAGVILVITPEFAGTRLSGAARWLTADRALIQLSLRHKTNDQFWFSVYHEGGHLLSRNRHDAIDEVDDEAVESDSEAAANLFARDMLIDPGAYVRFIEAGVFSVEAVRAFASDLEVAPGIVVGRLQRDHHIGPQQLNNLKKPTKLTT